MKKNNALIGLVILFVLNSCHLDSWDGTTPDQQAYLDRLEPPKPTYKEKVFVDSLQKKGFDEIELTIPIIGEICKGCSTYKIKMKCPFYLTEENKDSVLHISERIAKELYRSIMADSVIEDFGRLTVRFKLKDPKTSEWSDYHERSYGKHVLERWTKFKVVQQSSGKFERIAVAL